VNITITDSVDDKLDKIMQKKEFKNRADAVAWLIEQGFEIITKEAAA